MKQKQKKNIWATIAALGVLILAGILVYSNTFLSAFQYDDKPSISNNYVIRNISHLNAIWNFWPTRFLTYLSLAFNYHFHRLNVLGYHVFNLAIHLGCAILAWWLTLLTFSTPVMKDQRISRHSKIISFLVGLIFITHPIQTQAITYIIQRAASMAAFFYLASICLYTKSRLLQEENKASGFGKVYYLCSLISAIAAMFTKEMAITLPLMIWLYEFSFFKKEDKRRLPWRLLIPFLLTLVIIPLTMVLTKSVNFGEMRRVGEPLPEISSLQYLLTQFRVIVTYIRLLFLPINQNLDYDYPIAHTLFQPSILASFLFLVGIIIAALKLFRNHRLLSFGICWFFLALLPESSVIPIKDVIYEHRLYLPMFGFSLFLTSGIYYLFCKHSLKAMAITLMIITVSYSTLTYQRNKIWKDNVTLWNDVIRKSPHKTRAYNNRGLAYQNKGNLDQAISDYNKAIELNHKLAEAYNNRGLAYQNKGNLDQAILDFNQAIEIDPNFAESYYNKGDIYRDKGALDQAISDYNKAIEIAPNYADAYNNQGLAYQGKGNFDQALFDFNKAIEIAPDYAKAYLNKGTVYVRAGNLDQALLDFNKAIEIAPDYAEAYYGRGITYQGKGNLDHALLDFNKAIEIAPNYSEAYNNRGNVYSHKGNLDRAILDYNRAIEIKPNNAEAYHNRGNVYYAKGDYNHAISDYNKAIALNSNLTQAYYNRASAYYLKHEYDKSWQDIRKVESRGYKVESQFLDALKKASGREN